MHLFFSYTCFILCIMCKHLQAFHFICLLWKKKNNATHVHYTRWLQFHDDRLTGLIEHFWTYFNTLKYHITNAIFSDERKTTDLFWTCFEPQLKWWIIFRWYNCIYTFNWFALTVFRSRICVAFNSLSASSCMNIVSNFDAIKSNSMQNLGHAIGTVL